MYSKDEKPIIRASIFYFDEMYDALLGSQVRDILHKHGFFPPDKMYADKLTRGRFKKYSPVMYDLFPLAYAQKEIFGISMASGDSKLVEEFWKFDWNFTFYKNKKLAVVPKFRPWNVLSLDTTYGRMSNDNLYEQFFLCVRELIELLHPFYARIDDVANINRLEDAVHNEQFRPENIRQVFWGNYFDTTFYPELIFDGIANVLDGNVHQVTGGIFFTLTDNVFDATTLRCDALRESVKNAMALR